jgi:hypothetical protein
MPRPSKTSQELGYLRTAWEEIEDMQLEHHVLVTVKLIPVSSRGVWNLRGEIVTIECDTYDQPIGRSTIMMRFPNGHNTTFAGELWNMLHKLNIEAGELRDRVTRAL